MPVDPELQPLLDLIAAVGGPPPSEVGATVMREQFEVMCAGFGPGPDDVVATDLELAGRGGPIPARRYVPAGASTPSGALVFLHGGGFVIGSLASHDALCRTLADSSGAVVVAVDYRLAPEHPFPAAVEDATDALVDVVARADELGIDPARIAVGGDSAGGNLTAVVARSWRDLRRDDPALPALRLQVLIYPVCDLSGDDGSYDAAYPSRVENADGYFLTADTMRCFLATYQPHGGSPDASPLLVDDLADLPPAVVLTAEMDPLRDEGERYADALRAAGVEVSAERWDGAIHGFVQMGSFSKLGASAAAGLAAAVRDAVG